MSKFRKVASLVIAASMITSSAVISASAAVATTQVENKTAIQTNIQDGVILHAFNWSYNSIKENLAAIAAAGYTTVQTSPVQQPKDYNDSKDVTGQWWKLYQPVSLKIAEKSWLGTKDELKALCTEADKYGIKIICDIVSNHMGNETEENPNSVSPQVKTYQPDFYENKDTYFRSTVYNVSDSSVKNVVTGHLSNCPDLVTGNQVVQDTVVSLLKECIDCGVDGFRFDAAKHIETEDDGEYASDYWKEISTEAASYYKQKTGGDIYIYGEILNNCGASRKYSSYTKYINVTDNRTGDAVLANVAKGNASTAVNASYKSGVAASDVVLWAESHDTYEGDAGSAGYANTANISDEDVVKAWAIVGSRKDATALYLARPGKALMGEAGTDITYKSTAVSEINKFHNLFVGQSEKLGAVDNVAYVARGTKGIVLANCGGTTKSVSIAGTGLADGTYTDTITGTSFKVSGGTLTGTIGSTGVAVVYNGTTTPRNTNTVESSAFEGDALTITLGLDNATSGTYSLDGSKAVSYTGTTSIRIGSDYAYGDTITLTLTATDGKNTTTSEYKYVKKEKSSSGVYVFFKSEGRTGWKPPFNIYVYDEDTDSDYSYSNTSWPGAPMQFDEATGYYYYEVPSNSCTAKPKNGGDNFSSSYDLAHSANTYVILSYSAGQYPADGSKSKLKLEGKSKIFAATKSTSWEVTDLKPQEAAPQPATDVTRDPNAPTIPKPTTPSASGIYGDVDLDGEVKIQDVTVLQRYLAEMDDLSPLQMILADVDGDNVVRVQDATYIMRYLAEMDGKNTGKPYQPAPAPTTKPQPTTAQPTTAKPTTPQPTTAPKTDTYTFYVKTTLGWMTTDGVSLYVYDTTTGESYQLEKDENAWPNVYTADVPKDMSMCVVYRNLEEVSEFPEAEKNCYNTWLGVVSSTDNCFTIGNDESVSVGPYVPETKPEFELDRVYYDNSKSKWSEVYIYGWAESYLGNQAVKMTQISGTNIWYYDFDEPLAPGSSCFLFKNTAATWEKQTQNVTVVEGMNCYVGPTASKGAYSWTVYNE